MTTGTDVAHSEGGGDRRAGLARVLLAHPVLSVFVLAFTIRAVSAVVIWLIWGGTIFGDEATYSEMATAVAEGRKDSWDGYTIGLYWRTATWTLPLTALYVIFTPSILVGQLLAAVMGAAAAALVTRLASEALATSWALLAGAFVGLFPSLVLWSSLTLKDAAVWAVAVSIGVAVARVSATESRRAAVWAVLLVLSLVLMAYLRAHTFVVVTWAVAIALAVTPTRRASLRISGAGLLLVTLPWLLGLGPAALGFVFQEADTVTTRRLANAENASTAIITLPEPEHPEGRRSSDDGVGRGSGTGARSGDGDRRASASPGGAAPGSTRDDRGRQGTSATDEAGSLAAPSLRQLPRGLVLMVLDPLPTMIDGNPRVRLAALEHFVWYPLLVLALAGLPAVWGNRRVLAYPLLAAGGITFVYALTEGNFGTAYRHRGEIVWAVALLAAFGTCRLWTRVKDRQGRST